MPKKHKTRRARRLSPLKGFSRTGQTNASQNSPAPQSGSLPDKESSPQRSKGISYRYLDLEKISLAKDAALIARVMMATNDIQTQRHISNQLVKTSSPGTKDFDAGCHWYLLRMRFAHALEMLEILNDIKKSDYIGSLIRQDHGTSIILEKLLGYRTGNANEAVGKTLKANRDKTAFHYDSSWWKEAMQVLLKHQGKAGRISEPDDQRLPTRYIIADQLIEVVWQTQVLKPINGELHGTAKQSLVSTEFLLELIGDIEQVFGVAMRGIQRDFALAYSECVASDD